MRSLTISLTIVMALSVYAAVDATPAAPTGANVGAASRVAIPWGPKAATATITLADDTFPTGHDTPEGVACDMARAFIARDASKFLDVCIKPDIFHGQSGKAYREFLQEKVEGIRIEAARSEPSPLGPKAIGICFAARHLSMSGPASDGYASYDFQDVMFVDVGNHLYNGERRLVRTLVIRDRNGMWYTHPAPGIHPLLSMGLNQESKGDHNCVDPYDEIISATRVREEQESLDALGREIAGKQPREVYDLIVKRFGIPDRQSGSGIGYEHWDVAGGELTYTGDLAGYSPRFTRNGVTIRLVRSTECVRDGVEGNYQMTTLPDPKHSGMMLWIGNVYIHDGTYHFEESETGEDLSEWPDQSKNFFMRHREGKVSVTYAKGIGAETLLEDVPDVSRVATLAFTPDDGGARASFFITTHRNSAGLSFGSEKPLPFKMSKGW